MKFNYKPYASLATATALAQLFVLLVSPIVTRLYSQDQFGAFGLVFGIGAFLGSMAAGRLELAIPVAKSSLEAVRRFALGSVFALAFSAILTLAVVAIWLLDLPVPLFSSSRALLAIPMICCTLAVFQLSGALVLWHKDYRSFGLSKLAQGICVGIFQIVLGLAALGGAGLVLAQAAGYAAAVLVGLRSLVRSLVRNIRQEGAFLRRTLVECWRFPAVMMPAAIFNQASQQLPMIAIAQLYGLSDTGLFAFTYRICAAPLGLVSQSVSQVYASEFRNLLADGERLRLHFRAMLIRLLTVGVALMLAIVAGLSVADRIGVFGPGWSRLGEVALCLVPSMLMDFVATPLSSTLGYLERQRTQLFWDIGRFGSVLLAFAVASVAELQFLTTLQLYSVTWALGMLVHLGLTYSAARSLRSRKVGLDDEGL